MSLDAYQRALALQQQNQQQIESHTHAIRQLQAENEELDRFLSTYRKILSLKSGEALPVVRSGTTDSSRSRSLKVSIGDSVEAICIKDAGPHQTPNLLSVLDEQGIAVGGKNRATNLASILSRDPRFKNIRGEGWVLASDPRYKVVDLPFPEIGKKTASTNSMEEAV